MEVCSTVCVLVRLMKLLIKQTYHGEEYTDQWFVFQCWQKMPSKRRCRTTDWSSRTRRRSSHRTRANVFVTHPAKVTVVTACTKVFASFWICLRMCRWRFGEHISPAVKPTQRLQVPDMKVYFLYQTLSNCFIFRLGAISYWWSVKQFSCFCFKSGD